MAFGKINVRRVAGVALSFLLLAALLALFFEYRRHARLLHAPPFSIHPSHLPYYAFCSFYRMAAAYVIALVFSIAYGLLAARSPLHERIMIPAIDIAQSVPVVGFFPAAIYFFVALAHGGRLGVEMAAIFLIFTSQAWNMTLGVFEAVKTVPEDSSQALEVFGVVGWLKFKRLLMPACVPKLVYNSILSWVAGWYYLIACEIIAVGPVHYQLPGLGSYLMQAAEKSRTGELVAALLTLLAIIVVMDVVVWQPLSIWAEKFRYEFAAGSEPVRSLSMLHTFGSIGPALSRIVRLVFHPLIAALTRAIERIPPLSAETYPALGGAMRKLRVVLGVAILVLLAYGALRGLTALARALLQPWPPEARAIPIATTASLLRIGIAYIISVAWTLACALAAAESPRFNRILAPVAEIVGSIPATALFPLIVVFVVEVTGGMNLAAILLILTGMQWYLLFNLLAGVNQLPEDLKEAARAFGLGRIETWRKLVIPALVPSLVTGSITAWGGGWNALILSEYFVYRDHTYQVLGLGALLDVATYQTGNGLMILLSLLSMVAIVIGLNRLVWRRLYEVATERFKLDY
jgi:NitT/TauT family transport system permease protein